MGEDGALSREAVVGSLIRKVLVGPYLPHDLHRLPEQFPVLRVLTRVCVGVKLWALIRPDPPAETDVHTSTSHIVQDRDVLCEPDRMPPRDYVGHLPDADPRCPRREIRAEKNRVRQVAQSVGPEVVFTEPHGLEAELLSQDRLLSEVVNVLLSACGLPCGPRYGGESCEPHVSISIQVGVLCQRHDFIASRLE